RHTRFSRDWSSDVCSSDLKTKLLLLMLLFTATAHGQNSYLFRVTDTNLIPKNPLQLNSVNNQLAQTLYNTLSITKFEQAHPKSRSEERRVGKECRYRTYRE